jgi:Methyltransferase domain
MSAVDAEPRAAVATATEEHIRELMHRGDQAAWSNAALALTLADRGSDEQRRAATELLDALGIDLSEASGQVDRQGTAGQAAAPLLQTATLLSGEAQLWAGQTDEALIAQGRASAQGAESFRQFGLPMLPGLADALATPGAQMLDVGTGVAALAVAYAELFPALTVIGLDVMPRVLALAAKTVAASRVARRVILREQDVSTLVEEAMFALAWLPAPFIPEPALRTGVIRVVRALLPGGWVMLGHGKFTADPIGDALNRFKRVAYGGTALDDAQAQALLEDAGLTAVVTMPTPAGAPAITVGQKALR